jgi:ribosome recycling factor
MSYFRIEIMNDVGKSIEVRYMELNAQTVEEAMRTESIKKLRKEASHLKLAFRVTRQDQHERNERSI